MDTADLEKMKFQNEIAIQELEKKLKEKELNRIGIFEPQKVTIIVALIGLLGLMISNYFQRSNQLLIEEKKFQYSIYQKALESKDQENAAKILDFYIKANLLPGEIGKYSKLVKTGNELPIYNPIQKKNSIDYQKKIDSIEKRQTFFIDSVRKASFGRTGK